MESEARKALITKISLAVHELLIVGKISGDRKISDLGVTMQLVLMLASKDNLEELKVFLKNYMELGEEDTESAIDKALKIPACMN